MNEQDTIIKVLTENGGKVWEKGTMRRVYFNPQAVMKLEINRYNTGNIRSATCQGERISNSEAYRAIDTKVWYDLGDGKFHWRSSGLHSVCSSALDSFIERMQAQLLVEA